MRLLATILLAFLTLPNLALSPGSSARAETDGAAGGVFSSIVRLTSEIPADARTAAALGAERQGNGIVIDDQGLVLTIGYLILEAMSVTVFDIDGRPVQSEILAYDSATGFGLVRARSRLKATPIKLGDSAALAERDPVLVAGFGGRDAAIGAVVVARRAFAGYWEYLLESAIFTTPPYRNWGGAALIGLDGRLLGVGSLSVPNAMHVDERMPGNMFVPINLLKPILADLLELGRVSGPRRPWLGMFTTELGGRIMVTRVSPDGPAASAGVQTGDVVVTVNDNAVAEMAQLFREVWRTGAAGAEIRLGLVRDGSARTVVIASGNRYDYLRLQPTY